MGCSSAATTIATAAKSVTLEQTGFITENGNSTGQTYCFAHCFREFECWNCRPRCVVGSMFVAGSPTNLNLPK